MNIALMSFWMTVAIMFGFFCGMLFTSLFQAGYITELERLVNMPAGEGEQA
jgi:hypothetical protein